MKSRLTLVALLILGFTSTQLNALDFKEGNWVVSFDTEVIAFNMHLPTITQEQCLTKENAIPQPEQQDACQTSKLKTVGSTITWSLTCPDSHGNGKVIYKGKTFTSSMNMISASGEMKMKIKGTYKGPCNK